jgi:hypothetical protein
MMHGDHLWWWKKPEYLERTSDNVQATDVISNFLSGRKFNVRVKSIYSDIQEQEMKVPIGKHTLCYIA